jgi:hypothetical protein
MHSAVIYARQSDSQPGPCRTELLLSKSVTEFLYLRNMRRLVVFYIVIAIPLSLLVYLSKLHVIDSRFFVFGLFTYCFIYHPLICGLRLISLGIIPRSKYWRTVIAFPGDKYFWQLFFGVKFRNDRSVRSAPTEPHNV